MSDPTWTAAVHWNVAVERGGGTWRSAKRGMPAEYFANLEDIGNGHE